MRIGVSHVKMEYHEVEKLVEVALCHGISGWGALRVDTPVWKLYTQKHAGKTHSAIATEILHDGECLYFHNKKTGEDIDKPLTLKGLLETFREYIESHEFNSEFYEHEETGLIFQYTMFGDLLYEI